MIAPMASCATAGQYSTPAKFNFRWARKSGLSIAAQSMRAILHSAMAPGRTLRGVLHRSMYGVRSVAVCSAVINFRYASGGWRSLPCFYVPKQPRSTPGLYFNPATHGKKEIHVY